jgi:hypothetical protein
MFPFISQNWKHHSYFQFFMSCCFDKYWFLNFCINCSVGQHIKKDGFHLCYPFVLRGIHVFRLIIWHWYAINFSS